MVNTGRLTRDYAYYVGVIAQMRKKMLDYIFASIFMPRVYLIKVTDSEKKVGVNLELSIATKSWSPLKKDSS